MGRNRVCRGPEQLRRASVWHAAVAVCGVSGGMDGALLRDRMDWRGVPKAGQVSPLRAARTANRGGSELFLRVRETR